MVIHLLSQVMNIYFLFCTSKRFTHCLASDCTIKKSHCVQLDFSSFFVGKLSSLLGLSLSLLILLEMHTMLSPSEHSNALSVLESSQSPSLYIASLISILF